MTATANIAMHMTTKNSDQNLQWELLHTDAAAPFSILIIYRGCGEDA